MSGPCTPWATLADAQAIPQLAALDAAQLTVGLQIASELLYDLTAQQFSGVCTDVVRPMRRYPNGYALPTWWRWDRSWGLHTCGLPLWSSCGCAGIDQISLGAYPVRDITEVRIDGAVFDPTKYRIDDRRWLVRLDGEVWPLGQRLDLDPATDAQTFQVAFRWGQAPNQSGVTACCLFGGEIAKSLIDPNTSQLPQRVKSIVSQGVNIDMYALDEALKEGLTGLYLVDQFIKAKNPNRLRRNSAVISPDVPKPVRRTSTVPGS